MDVLWHVVMVVSLCTCVYSAGLFSFLLEWWMGKISKSHEAGCWNLFSEFFVWGPVLHFKFAQVLVLVHIRI